MNPSISAISKWKYLLLLKLWCTLCFVKGTITKLLKRPNLIVASPNHNSIRLNLYLSNNERDSLFYFKICSNFYSDKSVKGTVVNREYNSIHEGSLRITRTVPLSQSLKFLLNVNV